MNTKSTFSKQQEVLARRKAQIEKELVAAPPWQLTGEVVANQRPQDSLLDEFVEFQTVNRVVPTITEETRIQIEDLIKSRIQENLFDNVVRKTIKQSAIQTHLQQVSTKKSEIGLGEIYTQQYEEQALGVKKEDPLEAEHLALVGQWQRISSKLDALSHQQYTPHISMPKDSAAVLNVAALTEEATPLFISTSSRLTPKEIKKPENKPKSRKTKKESFAKNKIIKDHSISTGVSREREKQMKNTAASGEKIDEEEINKDTTKMTKQLQEQSLINKKGINTPRQREEESKRMALIELQKMSGKNVTVTGDGVNQNQQQNQQQNQMKKKKRKRDEEAEIVRKADRDGKQMMEKMKSSAQFFRQMENSAQKAINEGDNLDMKQGKGIKRIRRSESSDALHFKL
ncbi:MAG: putative U3 small nucleolar ribonucleoprotein MPP10 [Streblomastix strix]|uniref:Putative U3 small nucleolar ribonucleoprotein MPP10 n=1 Tax=Streblomastix strix TaxID=222440 RepID=A0A5J4WT55_9EUKA|nr:MAG: putative U3 small nucleolar ribonucleoprotein MPP10 [Streblomastix strix]